MGSWLVSGVFFYGYFTVTMRCNFKKCNNYLSRYNKKVLTNNICGGILWKKTQNVRRVL